MKVITISCLKDNFSYIVINEKKPANIDLKILVSGTHLKKKFGSTIDEIKLDKFNTIKKIIHVKTSDIVDISGFSTTSAKKLIDNVKNKVKKLN